MDDLRMERKLDKAASRAASRGHGGTDRSAPEPRRIDRARGRRDADALLERLRKGKGSLAARG